MSRIIVRKRNKCFDTSKLSASHRTTGSGQLTWPEAGEGARRWEDVSSAWAGWGMWGQSSDLGVCLRWGHSPPQELCQQPLSESHCPCLTRKNCGWPSVLCRTIGSVMAEQWPRWNGSLCHGGDDLTPHTGMDQVQATPKRNVTWIPSACQLSARKVIKGASGPEIVSSNRWSKVLFWAPPRGAGVLQSLFTILFPH